DTCSATVVVRDGRRVGRSAPVSRRGARVSIQRSGGYAASAPLDDRHRRPDTPPSERSDAGEVVVGGVEGAGAGGGGDGDVFETHAPLAGYVDAGFDAERVPRFERARVTFDDVRVFVFLHADPVAGAVDEVLAVAGV